MRILIITDNVPYPPVSGDRIRTYNLVRRVAGKHQVWLATLLRAANQLEGQSHMEEFCQGVVTAYQPRRHPMAHLPGLLRFALTGRPLELKFEHSNELVHKIRQLVSKVDFDVVHIEPSHMALYLEALPPHARCGRILVFHNIASDQYARLSRVEQRLVSRMRAWLHSRMMRQWAPRYAEHFDRCIAVSEADRRLLLAANPRLQIDVIPNGVDTRVHQPLSLESASPSLLYIGKMSYSANVDGALFLCREIMPHIRRRVPEVQLWIVGRDPTPEVRQLDGDGVHVTGSVDSVIPYYSQSTVCVVPLRAGGGTRLKILEAMALGRPVVSTAVGCEGLAVADGEHLLVADRAEQFAEKVLCLLSDTILWQRLATSARQLVVTRYDWDAIAGRLMQVYTEVTP